MGKQKWKQIIFLVTTLLTAVVFWNLERKSQVISVPETENSESKQDSGEKADSEEKSSESAASGDSADKDSGETTGTENSAGREKDDWDMPESIRVLIRSDNFMSEYQENVQVVCLSDTMCKVENQINEYQAGEKLAFSKDDEKKPGTVTVLSGEDDSGGSFCLEGLQRGYENPVYEGSLTLIKTAEGYLVINELSLERYLCKVVPSEMPSSYPLEALKAQAVCARTYAVKQMKKPRLGEEIPAHVDDSVNFQVYNNQLENERCTQAVLETEGIYLTREGELLDALYYSTSCGIDLKRDFSREAVFCAFLSMKNERDYEKDEPWYRWNAYFTLDNLTDLAAAYGFEDLGTVTGLILGGREESGRLYSMTVTGDRGSETVEGEYQIRKFLNPSQVGVKLQDGSSAPDLGMLPSAFFYVVPAYSEETLLGYQIVGGGYGHGIGLSQNGARHMAEEGMGFQEILAYYYREMELYETLGTRD